MSAFQLEAGDTGQAFLPVSAIAERVKQADASRSEADKVSGEGARTHLDRLADMRALTDGQRRVALAFLIGYAPETFDLALQQARS